MTQPPCSSSNGLPAATPSATSLGISPLADILSGLDEQARAGDPDYGPPPQSNEAARLAALHGYRILDTDFEETFDRLTRWARDHFQVPVALVSLVDTNRQWFKSACGLGIRETPRDVAFCNYTILHSHPMVVEDALEDPRFRRNPLVTGEPHLRFYAGAPLMTEERLALGTFCLIDYTPRRFSTADRLLLHKLAQVTMAEMHNRKAIVRETVAESETTPA